MRITFLDSTTRERWDGIEGEWNHEPDRAEWRDAATDLPCLALRHPGTGHWCGYVGVQPEHPLSGKSDEEVNLEVHGGVNFASFCQEAGKLGEHRVCHTPREGESDRVWWFGFDCAHAGDLIPTARRSWPSVPDYETYKNLEYVQRECARLAKQLHAAEASHG
jgi:hypothetical protein